MQTHIRLLSEEKNAHESHYDHKTTVQLPKSAHHELSWEQQFYV